MASHLRLDFHLAEGLAVGHTHTLPTSSGRMIVSHRCIFTDTGVSMGGPRSGPCTGARAVSAASSHARSSAAAGAARLYQLLVLSSS